MTPERKAYMKAYNAANRGRANVHKRAYRKRHLAEMAAYMRDYRAGKKRRKGTPVAMRWRCCDRVNAGNQCLTCGTVPAWAKAG